MTNHNIKLTAMEELLYMIEKGKSISQEDRNRLLQIEKLQLIQAYQLDPDLMKMRFRTAEAWFRDTYGK